MEDRSSIAEELPPGFSHETRRFGLSAEESIRALSLQSIVITGYRFQDGTSCCRACWPVWSASKNDRGHGFRMTVYRALDPNRLKRCAACGVPFNGETAQEEIDRRITKVDGSSPAPRKAQTPVRA
jgi:hypothetical protein